MPSFALIGAARGVGLELASQLVSALSFSRAAGLLLTSLSAWHYQSADDKNTVIVTVRNKERSTHIKELQQLRGGNLHVIEADVVDQPAMQVDVGLLLSRPRADACHPTLSSPLSRRPRSLVVASTCSFTTPPAWRRKTCPRGSSTSTTFIYCLAGTVF